MWEWKIRETQRSTHSTTFYRIEETVSRLAELNSRTVPIFWKKNPIKGSSTVSAPKSYYSNEEIELCSLKIFQFQQTLASTANWRGRHSYCTIDLPCGHNKKKNIKWIRTQYYCLYNQARRQEKCFNFVAANQPSLSIIISILYCQEVKC